MIDSYHDALCVCLCTRDEHEHGECPHEECWMFVSLVEAIDDAEGIDDLPDGDAAEMFVEDFADGQRIM